MRRDPRRFRNVHEGSVPLIKKQPVGRCFVVFGMTVLRLSLKRARRLLVYIPLHVIHYKQIQQAVVIHIEPRGTYRPERAVLLVKTCEAGLFGYVGESAVAIVVIEGISINASHKNVLKTVIVVVSDGHAGVIAGAFKAGLLGHIGESALAIVAE